MEKHADCIRHLRRFRSATRGRVSLHNLEVAREQVWRDLATIQNLDVRNQALQMFEEAVRITSIVASDPSHESREALRHGLNGLINYLEANTR